MWLIASYVFEVAGSALSWAIGTICWLVAIGVSILLRRRRLRTMEEPTLKDRVVLFAPTALSLGVPIIAGGVFASMNPVHILQDCLHIDCIGVGEGDELIPDYLSHMDDPGSVAGLVWRNGAEIVSNAQRPLICFLMNCIRSERRPGSRIVALLTCFRQRSGIVSVIPSWTSPG